MKRIIEFFKRLFGFRKKETENIIGRSVDPSVIDSGLLERSVREFCEQNGLGEDIMSDILYISDAAVSRFRKLYPSGHEIEIDCTVDEEKKTVLYRFLFKGRLKNIYAEMDGDVRKEILARSSRIDYSYKNSVNNLAIILSSGSQARIEG